MLMTPLRMVFRVEIRYISGFRPVMDGDAPPIAMPPSLHGPGARSEQIGGRSL
jgi:hypothetical protein